MTILISIYVLSALVVAYWMQQQKGKDGAITTPHTPNRGLQVNGVAADGNLGRHTHPRTVGFASMNSPLEHQHELQDESNASTQATTRPSRLLNYEIRSFTDAKSH